MSEFPILHPDRTRWDAWRDVVVWLLVGAVALLAVFVGLLAHDLGDRPSKADIAAVSKKLSDLQAEDRKKDAAILLLTQEVATRDARIKQLLALLLANHIPVPAPPVIIVQPSPSPQPAPSPTFTPSPHATHSPKPKPKPKPSPTSCKAHVVGLCITPPASPPFRLS